MSKMKHSGGLLEAVLELGYDNVKYFEITASGTAQSLSIAPPARKLILRNTDTTDSIYFNVTGGLATTTVGPIPGDNIKLSPGGVFEMDFDTLTAVSIVTTGGTALVEGILGWKGVVG